ncbi:MAG: MFS transporter [Lentisphaerae bacterium]|nr:MFS transporter [Lentisphaerota bacterium]
MKHLFKKPGVLALLLGGPLMMDFMIGLEALYVNLRTVDMGVPPRHQCLLAALWSTGYVIGAHCAGRWCTAKRAVTMMAVSVIGGATVICVVFLVNPSFRFFLAANLCFGLLNGFYFTPFQVKMGHIHPFHSMATAVAVYNMSWGTGLALGGIGCGWIMDMPGAKWIACGIVAAIALVQLLLIGSVDGKDGPEERTSEEITSAFASSPLQRRYGWIGILVGYVLFGGMTATLWPNLGRETGLTSLQIGIGAFVIAFQLPLLSLAWARLRGFMQKPTILVCLLLVLGLAYLLMPLVHHWLWHYAMLALLGVGFSGIVFHAVYYANADPSTRERSLGINESVVGVATLVGPLAMGWLAWNSGIALRPYLAGAALTILAALLITISWLKGRSDPTCCS